MSSFGHRATEEICGEHFEWWMKGRGRRSSSDGDDASKCNHAKITQRGPKDSKNTRVAPHRRDHTLGDGSFVEGDCSSRDGIPHIIASSKTSTQPSNSLHPFQTPFPSKRPRECASQTHMSKRNGNSSTRSPRSYCTLPRVSAYISFIKQSSTKHLQESQSTPTQTRFQPQRDPQS